MSQRGNESVKQKQTNCLKSGEMQVITRSFHLVLHLIDLKFGASFLDQSSVMDSERIAIETCCVTALCLYSLDHRSAVEAAPVEKLLNGIPCLQGNFSPDVTITLFLIKVWHLSCLMTVDL